MAIQFDLPLTYAATHPDAYAMIGDVHLHLFDEYAEVFVNVYDSEDARRQNVPDVEAHRRTPLKRIRVEVPHAIFGGQDYDGDINAEQLRAAMHELKAALYGLLKAVPEPHGLANFFKDGEQV